MNNSAERDIALMGPAGQEKDTTFQATSIRYSGPALVLYVIKGEQLPTAGGDSEQGDSQLMKGWLFGIGNYQLYPLETIQNTVWQVLAVEVQDLVRVPGGVTFKKGTVRHSGDRLSATRYLEEQVLAVRNMPVIGTSRHVGNHQGVHVGAHGNAIAGDSGSAVAGDYGTALAGVCGHAKAGESGTAIAGDRGHVQAGDYGIARTGEFGSARAGHGGIATGMDCSHATAGDAGRASAGCYGQAQVGARGVASVGWSGRASAGENGEIHIRYRDTDGARVRTAVGYIGENGLKPDVLYKLDTAHEFVEAGAVEGGEQ